VKYTESIYNFFVFSRSLRNKLTDALADTLAVLIIDARQVGKTTLARSVQNENYLTFDDANALSIARKARQTLSKI